MQSVLILSPYPEEITAPIEATGDRWRATTDAVLPLSGFDWIIAYGYRHVIKEPALSAWRDRLLNLHNAYLPWNRGAHPNLWAWVDGTPHGVTIHHIDAGIDTGDIVAQRRVAMDDGETLASSYRKLHRHMAELFAATWPLIRDGRAQRTAQPPGGTCHVARDIENIHLPAGWDTPVAQIARKDRA